VTSNKAKKQNKNKLAMKTSKKTSSDEKENKTNNNRWADIRNRTVTSDWSIAAGRLSHMNDPKQDNKVYSTCMTATFESQFSTSATVPVVSAYSASISQFANAAGFLAVFDQYRICQLEVWAIPTGALAAEQSALFKSVVDYDNTTATATTAYFDSYANVHTTTLSNGHYRRFTPHIAIAGYGGAFNGYVNSAMQWIDSTSTGVLHYATKYYVDVTTSVVPVDLIVRAWIQLRNPL
jgi:hypothetical protein